MPAGGIIIIAVESVWFHVSTLPTTRISRLELGSTLHQQAYLYHAYQVSRDDDNVMIHGFLGDMVGNREDTMLSCPLTYDSQFSPVAQHASGHVIQQGVQHDSRGILHCFGHFGGGLC